MTEFFKVRFLKGKASLESYVRTMNEVFEGKEKNFSKDGIVLGLTEENVPYLTNEDGTHISFVQEREVWHYDRTGFRCCSVLRMRKIMIFGITMMTMQYGFLTWMKKGIQSLRCMDI